MTWKSQKENRNETGHGNAMRRFFLFFLGWQVVCWTILPRFTLRVLPLDALEALTWGRGFSLGNSKHPPLSGWVAGAVDWLTCRSDWGIYCLSQIFVVLGLYYCYRVARLFFDEEKAITAALLETLIFYYNFTTPEFNVNVMLLALWPMTAYYCLQGIRCNRMRDWVMFGVTAGLSFLTKYVSGLLFVALFAILLKGMPAQKKKYGRTFWGMFGPYAAVITGTLVILPHVLWAASEGFPTLEYVQTRAEYGEDITAITIYVVRPLIFLMGFAVPWILPAGVLCFSRKTWKIFGKPANENARKAFATGGLLMLIPVSILFFGVMFGAAGRTMWLSTLFFPLGLVMVSLMPEHWSKEGKRRFRRAVSFFFALACAVYLIANLTHTSIRKDFNAKEFATYYEKLYESETGQNLAMACGDVFFSGVMSHYAPSHPYGCIYNNPSEVKRMTPLIRQNGALAISDATGDVEFCTQRFGMTVHDELSINTSSYQALFGKKKERTIYYAYLPPSFAARGDEATK